MKVTIDETTLNKAIREGKLELSEWLIKNSCPVDSSVYIQNFNTNVLNWIKSKDIPIPKKCLSDVIDKTGNIETINWFIQNGAEVNSHSLNSCIKNGRNELLWEFMKTSKLPEDSFKTAILSENIEVMDYLKGKLKIDDDLAEIAMKNKKKESLKWLVINNLF